jgi:hypothetical protein
MSGNFKASSLRGILDTRKCVENSKGQVDPDNQRKASYTLSVKQTDFTVWGHTWRKYWVNCAVLTGNSAGLSTVLSSRLSHRELRSSLSESHSLPADTTMASSQGTSVSSNSFSRWASHDILLFKYHLLLHILRLLFLFRITLWPMWLANSKRQPCFYPP